MSKQHYSPEDVMDEYERFNILLTLPRKNILDKKGNVDEYYVHDVVSIIYNNILCPHCQMVQFHKVMSELEYLGHEESCLWDFHKEKPFDAKYFVSVLNNYIEANAKIDELLTFNNK